MTHSSRKHPLWTLVLLCFLSPKIYAADSQQPLKFAVFPYFSAAQLIKLHKPLKQYLVDTTQLNMSMVTASSFKQFNQNTAQQHYDIIITAPHLGRKAQLQHGYKLIGFTTNTSQAILAAKKIASQQQLSDFKGQSITLPPKAAIVHHLALKTLREAGLEPGKDITIKATKSHNNAMISVIEDITPLAAFGQPTWSRFQPPGRENLVEIARSESIPGFAILIHPRVTPARITKIQSALFAFEHTSQGKHYYATTGLQGLRGATSEDVQQMDFYLHEIQRSNP